MTQELGDGSPAKAEHSEKLKQYVPPEPFEVLPFGDELVLTAAKRVTDRSWGAWFGPIQSALKNQSWDGSRIAKCHIDFSGCVWADPLPLLSLALALLEFEDQDHSVSLRFGSRYDEQETGVGEADKVRQIPNRFLKFLAREGFLRALVHPRPVAFGKPSTRSGNVLPRVVRLGSEFLTEDLLKEVGEMDVALVFGDSTCLPCTLLSIESVTNPNNTAVLDEIDDWVERALVDAIEPVVGSRVPSWAQGGIKYRLLMVLREALHNVAEHAYQNAGYAATYIRFRMGALGQQLPSEMEAAIRLEQSRTEIPLRIGDPFRPFISNRRGFFEVFVSDTGNGLFQTLKEHVADLSAEGKLNKAMQGILRERRTRKASRDTSFGGMHLMGQLLEMVHDHILVFDEDTWWGTELPLSDAGAPQAGQFSLDGADQSSEMTTRPRIFGLSLIARLSWLEDTAIKGIRRPWYGPENAYQGAIADRGFLLDEYLNDPLAESPPIRFPIIDRRLPGQYWNNPETDSVRRANSMLFLPGTNWMRSRIQSEILSALETGWLQEGGTLIIGDIPPEEACTYLAATEEAAKFQHGQFMLISCLVLVTRDLKASVLERNASKSLITLDYRSQDYLKNAGGGLHPETSLRHYFRLLRWHDSRRVWEIASPKMKENSSPAYLDQPVTWHKAGSAPIILDGYLDFAHTLTHPVCREIYSLALQRLLALHPHQNCKVVHMDALVESPVVRFNAEIRPPTRSYNQADRLDKLEHPRITIVIGSIEVSGQTEFAHTSQGDRSYYFFHHRRATGDGAHLLYWLGTSAKQEVHPPDQSGTPRYQRVGRTPMIAWDGWKAYRVPRFDSSGRSLYGQCPRDSYRAWQEPSRSIMKLGHWGYGGHHDLLTINLLLAFDTGLDNVSLAVGGSLARFVYANLFAIFSVDRDDLTVSSVALFDAIEREKVVLNGHLLPRILAEQRAILIYPSHPVTDHVVNRFLGMIDNPTLLDDIRGRIRGILPVRRNRTGSGLQVSGLTLEWLRKAASRSNKTEHEDIERDAILSGTVDGPTADENAAAPPVVIFDDALITGRTFNDLKRLLRDQGFKEIYSLVLLDRQRLPATDHVENSKHVCYWRLDVPTLGTEMDCPLCRAVEKARNFRHSVSDRTRLDAWFSEWAARNPTTEWGDAGLRAIYLDLDKRERKFGIIENPNSPGSYEQIGGEGQQIRITTSAGLVCWVTEMHANTSRDDLALTFPKKETGLSAETRVQLIASQLLLYRGEFDAAIASDLRKNLLASLWDDSLRIADRHTALGTLALLACRNDELKQTMSSFIAEKGAGILNGRNHDFVLLVAFCIQQNLIGDTPILVRASRLLMPRKDRRDIYYRFHREIQDVSGKAHTPPLQRLVNAAGPIQVRDLIPETVASLEQLDALVSGMRLHWLRAEAFPDNMARGKNGVAWMIGRLKRRRDKLLAAVRSLGEALKQPSTTGTVAGTQQRAFGGAQRAGRCFMGTANVLHRAIFVPLALEQMKEGRPTTILEVLRAMILAMQRANPELDNKTIKIAECTAEENMQQVELLHKPNLKECFAVWDVDVSQELRHLLTNVRHATTGPISSPFTGDSPSDNEDLADMWINVVLDPERLVLKFANRAKPGCKKIEGYLACHEAFEDLGGDARYEQDERVFVSTIRWRYAHTLTTTQGVQRLESI